MCTHVSEFLKPEKRVPPVVLWEDNKGDIYLAQNPLSSGRIKYIHFRYHYVREEEEGGNRTCVIGGIRRRHSCEAVECRKAEAPSEFPVQLEERELRPHYD